MRFPQLAAGVLALLLVLLLYLVPSTKPPKITRYDDLITAAYEVLPSAEAATVRSLESKLGRLGNIERKEALVELSRRWEGLGYASIAAEHLRQSAEIEPTDAGQWGLAGDRFFEIIALTQEETERMDYAFHAMYCYEQVLERAPDDLNRKLKLAQIHTDYRGSVMEGVLLLREIAEADPDLADAQLRLGRFAVMSGQLDRAEERFLRVLALDSLNLQARILLAETWVGAGRNPEAAAILEEGLELFDDSLAIKEIRQSSNRLGLTN